MSSVKASFIRSRRPHVPGLALLMGLALLFTLLAGCVERTIKIQSEPPGALVTVNDEEVGATPVKFAFLWYGDYEIILRKPGYETLKTHCTIKPPWYQYPPIDFVAEALVPTMLQDSHVLPTFQLEPAETPTVSDVVERAVELREQALCEQPG